MSGGEVSGMHQETWSGNGDECRNGGRSFEIENQAVGKNRREERSAM